jgi:predicted GTPase
MVAEQLENVRKRLQPLLPHRGGPHTLPGRGQEGGTADQTVADRLAGMRKEFEHAVVRLGIIGESGSGKSSLINAIVGRPVAPVGALVETTQEPQEVPVEGLILVDLPGCGTPTWPRDTYLQRLRLLEAYDGFILVTAQRIKECDALLYAELARKANKPFFVVRSHFDLAVAAHGEQEGREVIPPYIRRQLQAGPDLPVYLVSSVGREHFDLERLILDIRNVLPEWKRVRFTMAAHAYGPETLARKREAAERVVGIYAGLAAANALNPIPGLDISVDVGILTKMARYVISTYGLRKDQVEALQSQTNVHAAVIRGVREIAQRFTPYLTEKFVAAALRRMGAEVFLKSTSKWVPFVGTFVSAGLGYQLTYRFGDQLIDDCESAARQVIASLEADGKTTA